MKERIEYKTFTKMSNDSIVDYKELIKRAKELGQEAVAITDYNSVQIFPKVYRYVQNNDINNFKVIYGCTVNLLENEFLIPVTILVKNKIGLKNLYKIISLIKTSNFTKCGKQVITKKDLVDLSEGLLYGLNIQNMYDIYDNQTDEQIRDNLMWYDFVEVQAPFDNSHKNSIDYLKRIINIAKNNRKIVIATGNVCYLTKEEQEDYNIIFPDKNDSSTYLKSTEEMKKDFSFLTENQVYEIVIENPNKLNNLIEEIEILSDKLSLPKIDNSKKVFLEMVYNEASKLYGEKLPVIVEKRINEELYGKDGNTNGIINRNYEVIYLIYKKIVDYSNKLGYKALARGNVSSSFIAYLLGITEINPLPAHYYCSNCHEIYFPENAEYLCGEDMPTKNCLKCSKEMTKDGFNLPYEMFLGYDASKIPKIDLNFASEIQEDLLNYIKSLFGEDKVLRAGTIKTYSKEEAIEIIENNLNRLSITLNMDDKLKLVNKLMGVKTKTGQHPGGLIIIPSDYEISDFTPECYPNDMKNLNYKSTHFDYHDLGNCLMKIDVLKSDISSIVTKLEKNTNVKFQDIPLNDKSTFDQINKPCDEVMIIDKNISYEVLEKMNPTSFSQLLKVIGVWHSFGSYYKDLEKDIIISCREDLLDYLLLHNIDIKTSYKIVEQVSTGKSYKCEKNLNTLKEKLPLEFIKDLSNIEYLFTKSHIVSLTLSFYRLYWYKTHYPLKFKSVIKEFK